MAEKFAVYSDDKDVVDLAQVLRLRKALSVPEWIEGMVAGGTFAIPDTGSADAADRVVVYMVECASGTTGRTIYLPANPRDGQVLIIKDLNAGRSAVTIEGAGGSDTIDGATSYILRYDNQSVMLRAQTYAGPIVLWSILAEHRPNVLQANWGNPLDLTSLGATSVFLDVGYRDDNTPSPNGKPVYMAGSGKVLRFSADVSAFLITTGDITVNLMKNGITQMTLGPYDNTDPDGFYATTAGAFSFVAGDGLTVQIVLANTPAGTSAVYAVATLTLD